MKITARHLFELAGLKIPESLGTPPLTITWRELEATQGEEEDNLTRTSKWSQNTYSGADNLLYGEATRDGQLVGRVMIGVFPDMLEIDKIWVAGEARRQGIGKQLVAAAIDRTGIQTIVAPHTTGDGEKFVKRAFSGGADGALKLRESATPTDDATSVVNFLRENCSDYLWMFTDPNPTLLYAGSLRYVELFTVQHSAPRQRITVANSLLDASDKPSGMPSRSRSIFATPNHSHAQEFGDLAIIIPFNEAKIAATSATDFAEITSIWPIQRPFSTGYTQFSWGGVLNLLGKTLHMTAADMNNPDKWSEISDKLEADPELASTTYQAVASEQSWWMSDVVPLIERGFLETVLNRVFQYSNMSHPFTVLQASTLNNSHPGGETVIEGSVVRISDEMYEQVAELLAKDHHSGVQESHASSLSAEGLTALKAYTASGGNAEGQYRGTSRGRADFHNWLKSGLYKGATVYRGLGFTDAEWDAQYERYTTPGEVIQFDDPQSFTKNRTRASSYGSGPIQVRLYTNTLVGRDISKQSHYPEEEEVLMAGGESLKVVAAEYKAGGIWWIEVAPA
jgi:GNAT superfamily N-acetyltransferase